MKNLLLFATSALILFAGRATATDWAIQCNSCHLLQNTDAATIDAVEAFAQNQPSVQPGDSIDVYKKHYPPSGNVLTIEHWFGITSTPVNSLSSIANYGYDTDVQDKAFPAAGPVQYLTVNCGVEGCFYPTFPPFPVSDWALTQVN